MKKPCKALNKFICVTMWSLVTYFVVTFSYACDCTLSNNCQDMSLHKFVSKVVIRTCTSGIVLSEVSL